MSTPDHLYIGSGSGVLDLGPQRPTSAPSDARLDVVLPDLVRRGLAISTGTERVAGESCTTFRLGGPLGEPFVAATLSEHMDACVTNDGLPLSQDWWRDGQLVSRTTATLVDRNLPDPTVFQVANARTFDAAHAPDLVEDLPVNVAPPDMSRLWVAPHPPWKLRHTRRVVAQQQSLGPAAPVATLDAYVAGTTLVTVVAQPAGASAQPLSGEGVVVPGLGRGTATLTPFGAALHFVLDGTDLEVRGTANIRELVWFADRLHAVSA